MACGRLYVDMGRFAEALDFYQKAVSAFEQLVVEDPDDPWSRADLAESNSGLGTIYSATGRRDEALVRKRKALEIFVELAEENPDDLGDQSNLATAHVNVGLDQAATGRSVEALASYQAAIAIEKRLAAENPKVRHFQDSLSSFYALLGRCKKEPAGGARRSLPTRVPSRSKSGWSPRIPRYTPIRAGWPSLTVGSAACKWRWESWPSR